MVVGGGHGLLAALRGLRDDRHAELAVIVTMADDGGSSGALRQRREGPAVGDMRRSLISLAGDQGALARAFARPLTINRLGRHPLGNLVIRSVADAFGDLEQASEWLGEQLEISGRVLPATDEPVSLLAEAGNDVIYGESAIGAARLRVRRLRFSPERPNVPDAVTDAIAQADLVLLGPGSLFTSVLAAAALPDIAATLAHTEARVVWICNLEPEAIETAGMSAHDHLAALRVHGVRVDAVLYDPAAALHFAPGELARQGLEALPRLLRSPHPEVHDPDLLRAALKGVLSRSGPRRKSVRSATEQLCATRAIAANSAKENTSDSKARDRVESYLSLLAAPGPSPRKRA